MAIGLSLGLGLGARSGTSLAAQVAALFGPSDTGWFYDNSDFSTMFQNSAGTIPVTAVGQPVSLQLDKSKGLVRGAERIPAASGWTGSANWTVDAGAGRATLVNATTSTDSLTLSTNFDGLAVGRVYELTITVESVTGSVLFTGSRLELWSAPAISIPGTYRFLLGCSLAGAGALRVVPSGGAGMSAVVSGLSIRELPGNHRRQATSLNRPTLAQDGSGQYYLSYDGVNDSLSTSAFAWGTDKATVVAGYTRKNATGSLVCEFSPAIVLNTGSFYLFVNDTGGRVHSSASRGSASLDGSHVAGWTTAESLPTTSVISATHDIAGDLSTIRKNGVAGTNGTADKGTGNFGNYPVYFGGRGGTSQFFLGDEYSQFAINRLLTASELALVERYTNSRTGAY